MKIAILRLILARPRPAFRVAAALFFSGIWGTITAEKYQQTALFDRESNLGEVLLETAPGLAVITALGLVICALPLPALLALLVLSGLLLAELVEDAETVGGTPLDVLWSMISVFLATAALGAGFVHMAITKKENVPS